ncbi:MAG: hypothetical protein ABEK00_01755 [Candidatus Nanohaloarchaea archaeon]
MKFKGQTSMEFFLLFGISMAVLSILFGVITNKQANVFERHNREMAQEVASNVGFQVGMALVQGEGYSRAFYLPRKIAGTNYTVKVVNRTVYVGWNENFVVQDTLYTNRTIKFNTVGSSTFKALHNSSGVYVVDG